MDRAECRMLPVAFLPQILDAWLIFGTAHGTLPNRCHSLAIQLPQMWIAS
jgi:hypothetical protein